ncbi:MAG: TRAP transporter small permease [Polyangiaceae bacterium]
METDDHAQPAGAAWGVPLLRIDEAWQRFEARLCAGVLVAEILALSLWVMLRGLATDLIVGGTKGGLVWRCLLSMIVLAIAAHLSMRRRGIVAHRIGVTGALLLGMVVGPLWGHVGFVWSSNLLNWLQGASVLMLIGGLRGLVTRLTLWVALLGASLASSRGKHIHVDVMLHFVPPKLRKATTILSMFAGATVCAVGACGFVDYIAIAAFQVNAEEPCPGDASKSCDTPVGQKLADLKKKASSDFFLLGRQASLDIRSLPHVIAGTPYDQWMTGAQWNSWLDGADWSAHFPKVAIDGQHMDTSVPGVTHIPAVAVPGTGQSGGLLIRDLDMVFPVGLWVIAIKFLIRIALVISGHVSVDPDAGLEEPELESFSREATPAVPAGEVSR